ncbi:MAG: hypothetical protein ACRD40_14390 [Candidatus Acidiferrales bacterium]
MFLRQYVLHLTRIRPIRKITCRGLGECEGAGSQALMLMNAINFARFYGFEYVHTPFSSIGHAERPTEEWAAAWESLFNLGSGETPCTEKRREVVDFSRNFTELGRCFGCRWQWDEMAERFRATIPEFRRKYYVNKSPGKANHITVAVHIRRGDVSQDNAGYFSSNETILRTIATAQSVLNARDVHYKIDVHSQGARADFADFSRLGVELFLNIDAVWTMKELIKADVLITARGCFSYCAGLISDGIKIFEPQPFLDHNALPSWKWRALAPAESWIACNSDGSFDSGAFERQLVLLTETKGREEFTDKQHR